jgi:hypothetical protein
MQISMMPMAAFPVLLGLLTVSGNAVCASEPERLLGIIQEQERRIQSQEAQLAEQKRALELLRKQVESIQRGMGSHVAATAEAAQTAAAPKAAEAAETPKKVSSQAQAPSKKGYEGLEKATVAAHEDWPGSFRFPGTDTRMKISGFAELDIIHDSDAILTPDAFVTSAIVTRDATAAQGAEGKTNLSVKASRLQFETRTPFDQRRLTTFIAVDFFNDFTTTTPELRLREAYGEATDVLFGGDLLMGQTWSTYTNMYSYPGILEFQGPNALFGTRHPMLRWTKGLGDGLTLKLAGEAPDVRSFVGASSVTRWPDGVVALGWDNGTANVQGSFLARDLRASGDQGAVGSFGWGASIAGRVHMPGSLRQDFATFSLTYGEGIGGVLNDIPPDAAYDQGGDELVPIPTLAWFGSYTHWWNPKVYSVLSYGEVRQDNLDFQPYNAFRKTQYATANLSWAPSPSWLFGIEAAYGTREDKDGEQGSDLRSLFVSRLSF